MTLEEEWCLKYVLLFGSGLSPFNQEEGRFFADMAAALKIPWGDAMHLCIVHTEPLRKETWQHIDVDAHV